MKVLIFPPPSPFEPHFGVLLDEAEILRREGHEVHIIICDGAFDVSVADLSGNSAISSFCAKQANKFINKISKAFFVHTIKDYVSDSVTYKDFNYHSAADIKKIEYRGAKIGLACLSTYVSATRNLNPLVDEEFKHLFDYLLLQSCVLTDAVDNVLNDLRPDLVCLFNGRFFDSRPIFDLARQKNINTRCYDAVGDAYNKLVKTICYNAIDSNIKEYTSRFNEYWNSPTDTVENKTKLAREFFQKRRNGVATNDIVCIENQKKGLLPAGFDKDKRNIVIFNSSADEFAFLGDEYDRLSLFGSQIEALQYMFETFQHNDGIHFYLRVHPNLKKVKYKYHTDLYLFQEKYKNVTVIPSEDEISTYDLLDAAEKVIVFGSTMGVEAAYWGKAVILLAGCLYHDLDICYTPKSIFELEQMIVATLEPKGEADALKYAYFLMHKDPGRMYEYVDFTTHVYHFFGKTIHAVNYKKLLGSSILFAVYQGTARRFLKLFWKNRFPIIPTKEA